ncbi:MAG: type II toxin-antitoxin system PemK/MazF family toxin, partial [Brevibacterium sp.]|nr:type II toxin-antitoxin system PemK/MazF family toxin [Brevibacterium sp.]
MSWKSLVSRVARIGVREGFKFLRESQAKKKADSRGPGPRPSSPPQGDARSSGTTSAKDGHYPGDYRGAVNVSYAPDLDGDADPGEVVWGWVPYEEDHSQGK